MIYIIIPFSIFLSLAYACPTGSVQGLTPDDCYSVSTKKLLWRDAEIDCTKQGGHLTSVQSAFENNFIQKLAKQSLPNEQAVYVGGINGIDWVEVPGEEGLGYMWNFSD